MLDALAPLPALPRHLDARADAVPRLVPDARVRPLARSPASSSWASGRCSRALATLQGWTLPEVALFYGLVNMRLCPGRGAWRAASTFCRHGQQRRFRPAAAAPAQHGAAARRAGAAAAARRPPRAGAAGAALERCRRSASPGRCPRSLLVVGAILGGALPVLRPVRAAGDAVLLDHRIAGDHEHHDLRRRGDGAVPAHHLPPLVPPLLHLCRARWPASPTSRRWPSWGARIRWARRSGSSGWRRWSAWSFWSSRCRCGSSACGTIARRGS